MDHFAYLDPATGSLFIQTVIGGALAATVVFRRYGNALISKIKLMFSRQSAAAEEKNQ